MDYLTKWPLTVKSCQDLDQYSRKEKQEMGKWVSTNKYSVQRLTRWSFFHLRCLLTEALGWSRRHLSENMYKGRRPPMFPCQLQWSPLAWLFNELLFHLKQTSNNRPDICPKNCKARLVFWNIMQQGKKFWDSQSWQILPLLFTRKSKEKYIFVIYFCTHELGGKPLRRWIVLFTAYNVEHWPGVYFLWKSILHGPWRLLGALADQLLAKLPENCPSLNALLSYNRL